MPRAVAPALTLGPVVGGRPGMSLVYAAHDAAGASWAVKTLHPEASAMHALRFTREIEAHVHVSGVPGVVPATRHMPAHADGPPWLVMPWVSGGDVASAVDRVPSSREALAMKSRTFVRQLLDTVAAMHARGVAHRDIKPSNLLLDGDALSLTDFGIAARQDDDRTWRVLPPPHQEITAGTPAWAGPELESTPPAITPASDVYAVGKVWEWLRGLGATPALETRDEVLLQAMLAPNPHERPTSAEAAARLR